METRKNSQGNVSTGVNESYKDLGILEKMKEQKEKRKKGKDMDDAASTDSASKTLMSRHAMKMFFYTINLGRYLAHCFYICDCPKILSNRGPEM